MIDKETAILRVNPNQLDELLHPALDKASEDGATKLTKGLPKKYLEILREEMPEKKLTSLQDISDVATLLMSNKGDVLYGNIIPVTRSKRK